MLCSGVVEGYSPGRGVDGGSEAVLAVTNIKTVVY